MPIAQFLHFLDVDHRNKSLSSVPYLGATYVYDDYTLSKEIPLLQLYNLIRISFG